MLNGQHPRFSRSAVCKWRLFYVTHHWWGERYLHYLQCSTNCCLKQCIKLKFRGRSFLVLSVQRCHLRSADTLSSLLQPHSNCPTSGFWIFCSIPVNVEFSHCWSAFWVLGHKIFTYYMHKYIVTKALWRLGF